jgi:hypothetical protein
MFVLWQATVSICVYSFAILAPNSTMADSSSASSPGLPANILRPSEILKYGKLNLEQQTNIWRRFLEKAATPQGTPIYSWDAFDDWVRKERNGREVSTSFMYSRSRLINGIVSDQKPGVHGTRSGYSRGMPGDQVPCGRGYWRMRGLRTRCQRRGGDGSFKWLFLAEFVGSESMPPFNKERARRSGWIVYMSFGSGGGVSCPCVCSHLVTVYKVVITKLRPKSLNTR